MKAHIFKWNGRWLVREPAPYDEAADYAACDFVYRLNEKPVAAFDPFVAFAQLARDSDPTVIGLPSSWRERL